MTTTSQVIIYRLRILWGDGSEQHIGPYRSEEQVSNAYARITKSAEDQRRLPAGWLSPEDSRYISKVELVALSRLVIEAYE